MAEAEMKRISFLKKQINTVYLDIKAVYDLSKLDLDDEKNLAKFKSQYTEVKTMFDKFNHTWDTLLEFCIVNDLESQFPSDKDKGLRQSAKLIYFECVEAYDKHVTQKNNKPNVFKDGSMSFNESRVMRPQRSIPTFSGKIQDWPFFRDNFLVLVHNDETLADIEKFNLLINSIKDDALSIVQTIPCLEGNYMQAWLALNEAFDNKRKLAISYIEKVLNFKPAAKQNVESLRSVITHVSQNLIALMNMKLENAFQFILFYLAHRCLDPKTKEQYEEENVSIEFPSFESLNRFILERCKILEMSRTGPQVNDHKNIPQHSSTQRGNVKTLIVDKQPTLNSSATICVLCETKHTLMTCPRFLNMTPPKREELVQKHRLCKNCLFPGHQKKTCRRSSRCKRCQGLHHSLLHDDLNESKDSPALNKQNSSSLTVLSKDHEENEDSNFDVVLGTAMVPIKNYVGEYCSFRAVLDSASQFSFITKAARKRLNLTVKPFKRSVSGLNNTHLVNCKGKVELQIKSPTEDLITQAVVVPSIISKGPSKSLGYLYEGHNLADPDYYRDNEIDLLLGADVFTEILTGPPKLISPGKPKLVPTIFGDVIMGKIKCTPGKDNVITACLINPNEDLNRLVSKFWEIEEVEAPKFKSADEEFTECHFKKTHYRLESGRYVVSLPFRKPIPPSSSYHSVALKRLFTLETKLFKTPDMKIQYKKFMDEYYTLGHMERARIQGHYFLPHHAVSTSSKFRVVFDASCGVMSNALNNYLHTGPKLQQDISSIITNFRLHKYILICDVIKMYRQILVNPSDRKYQHILWRPEPNEKVIEYQLNTLTYGLSCSPYLSLRVLRQLAIDEGVQYPLASRALLEETYMDDIVSGGSTLQEVQELKSQLISLMKRGGFELDKWTANHPEILETTTCPQEWRFHPTEPNFVKVLGMKFIAESDSLAYEINVTPQLQGTYTKRMILSSIAKLFDPLGFLSPVIFKAKCIMQSTWQTKLDWDDTVPVDLQSQWHSFMEELPLLSKCLIPRYAMTEGTCRCQIIGFSDASSKGYACAVYLRVEHQSTSVHLLKAKSKLAPLKTISIPRLELCGALLLAETIRTLKPFMKRAKVTETILFTDSTVVLSWLNTCPSRMKTFVANRVTKILRLSEVHLWFHIPSKLNPADLASRGLQPKEILNNTLWWKGPRFLTLRQSSWSLSQNVHCSTEIPELKIPSSLVLTTTANICTEWMERFSSLPKLIRVCAYITRFKGPRPGRKAVSTEEYRQSLAKCIRLLQRNSWPEMFHPDHPKVPRSLESLTPFIDKDGIIRVGGRLKNANVDHNQKFPILIPHHHHFTAILIDWYHKMYAHVGSSTLQSIIRRQYWVPSMRSLVRRRLHKCLICYKQKRLSYQPIMGDIPSYRFSDKRAFENVGIDYAGPFLVRESMRKRSPTIKIYLCLFVCLSTKALHLEVAEDVSTQAFLTVLDKFIGRRGVPRMIVSDNGTNFLGASNKLRDWYMFLRNHETQDTIISYCSPLNLEWRFNPPKAPHFGGIWEAAVKSVKQLLSKMTGERLLTKSETEALFIKIEGILNSRPITPMSNDVDDLEPLTPGHFLIGQPLQALPYDEKEDIPENRLRRWQLINRRLTFFWQRWRTEYLQTLQRRAKWTKREKNVQIGDLVILHEETPVQSWPLARVVNVYPDDDGNVRVVDIKTAKGVYRRPVVKLTPLSPVMDDSFF